eukprot:2965628-Prymnesium_polylepis.2
MNVAHSAACAKACDAAGARRCSGAGPSGRKPTRRHVSKRCASGGRSDSSGLAGPLAARAF